MVFKCPLCDNSVYCYYLIVILITGAHIYYYDKEKLNIYIKLTQLMKRLSTNAMDLGLNLKLVDEL